MCCFLTPCSHCSPYSVYVRIDHTYKKKEKCCSSSAQSVWVVLAEVKTNTIVPVAGSQEEATASVEEGCYFFFVNFSGFSFPLDNFLPAKKKT